jgi:DNA-binding NtrC family response regulator
MGGGGGKMVKEGGILIVDDEVGPRESLKMILKPHYDIHTASNGQEALDLLGKEKIDVVTLDLKMPGLSGFDVLKEIKKMKAEIEVVIITSQGTLPAAREAIHYGAGDFITKPFNIADVISIISKAFERRNYKNKIQGLIKEIKELGPKGEKK